MTAMDILEALGRTDEELLCGCDAAIAVTENEMADPSAIHNGSETDGQALPEKKNGKKRIMMFFSCKTKYRRAAAALTAAAAVLLLVYVWNGTFISRRYDSGSLGSSTSTSTADSAEISADTAEEESAVEEAETAEVEEGSIADSAGEVTSSVTTDSEEATSGAAADSVTETEETETESAAQTESVSLEILELGEVYIPTFDTSSMTASEYAERMELVTLVQAEIDAALSQEMYETLPVYRFVRAEELERLGDYPVITAEAAEELLWQGYYLNSTGFSEGDIDSAKAASVELQYLIGVETQTYMPYYQFTVVVDGDMVFVCYVPAVSSEYLEGTLSGGAVMEE